MIAYRSLPKEVTTTNYYVFASNRRRAITVALAITYAQAEHPSSTLTDPWPCSTPNRVSDMKDHID